MPAAAESDIYQLLHNTVKELGLQLVSMLIVLLK